MIKTLTKNKKPRKTLRGFSKYYFILLYLAILNCKVRIPSLVESFTK